MPASQKSSQAITFAVVAVFFAVMFGSAWWFNGPDPSPPVETTARRTPAGPSGQDYARMAQSRTPGWRMLTTPSLPAGFDIFRSGTFDTYRSQVGAFSLHVKEMDPDYFGFWYTTLEEPQGKRQFASLRFCRRLSFRGNPQVDEFEKILEGMPATVPLHQGARPLTETQQDCDMVFRDMQLSQQEGKPVLTGVVESQQNARREYANFFFVIVDPEAPSQPVASRFFGVEGLLPNGNERFEVPLPEDVAIDQLAKATHIKLWLHFTSSKSPQRPASDERSSTSSVSMN